jgi:hypothetical protein
MRMSVGGAATIAALLSCAPAQAQTAPAESVYSTIDAHGAKKNCRKTSTKTQDEEFGMQFRCRGVAGIDVIVHYEDARDTLTFGRRGKTETALFNLGGPISGVRETLEWRGRRNAKGEFAPYAAIARLAFENPNVAQADWRSTLMVVRIAPNLKQSCLMGFVDARANADANDVARRVADQWAADPARPCGGDSENAPYVGKTGAAWKDRRRVDAP